MKSFLKISFVLAATILSVAQAAAVEVKVLSSAALKPIVDVLGPQFERTTGHKLTVRFELTPEVPKLIEAGEVFDVAIANPPHIEALSKSGKIVQASAVQVARFGLGVGIRAGEPKPDVSSSSGFKQTLLNAKSVAYVGAGTSGVFFLGVQERLGIADQMKPKLKPGSIAENIAAVAKGETEIVVMPAPLILAGSGIELAGAVPTEYQDHIVLVAGLTTSALQPDVGKAFIAYLVSPEADALLKAKGYERIMK